MKRNVQPPTVGDSTQSDQMSRAQPLATLLAASSRIRDAACGLALRRTASLVQGKTLGERKIKSLTSVTLCKSLISIVLNIELTQATDICAVNLKKIIFINNVLDKYQDVCIVKDVTHC